MNQESSKVARQTGLIGVKLGSADALVSPIQPASAAPASASVAEDLAAGQLPTIVHTITVGPTGSGKTFFRLLFNLPPFEPLRTREPRDEKDRLICISKADARQLYKDELVKVPFNTPHVRVGTSKQWAFLSERDPALPQCLHLVEKDSQGVERPCLSRSKCVEMFAPGVVEILTNAHGVQSSIDLTPSNSVVIFLNPTNTFYQNMTWPTANRELETAIFYNVTKRSEVQSKTVDIPDALKRIRNTEEELVAWKTIQGINGLTFIEFRNWKHCEFRYYQPVPSDASVRRELLDARDRLLTGLYAAKSGRPAIETLLSTGSIRSSTEILSMSGLL